MFHSRPVQFSSVHIMDKNCLPPSEKRCKNFSWSKKAYRLSQDPTRPMMLLQAYGVINENINAQTAPELMTTYS
ncbi:hypothetical protein WN944_016766 [Citrus x changshan-huyou]|uniref:Uncharacterized protein n=1 Tax=Citrus x changshan-huyou TaxID=2935761 RepID=A0AAP0QN50_9ROSI